LDIENLPYVINYDLPKHSAEYIHRVGRTGRAGRKGLALSFVSPNDEGMLKTIEQLLRKTIPKRRIRGYEPEQREEFKAHHEGTKEKIKGAFGHKKKKTPPKSKKTTKRGISAREAQAQKNPRNSSKKKGR
jgi:ATP-dependent RNA helicase RhlE